MCSDRSVSHGDRLCLCWIGQALHIAPATHIYTAFFTDAPGGSGLALSVGICWSLALGALIGASIALV